MKTKNLVIIFILFLLITLASGLVVFLTQEKNQPILSEKIVNTNLVDQLKAVEKQNKAVSTEAKKIAQPEAGKLQVEEKIKAVMIVSGAKYEAEVKAGSSVYDLMNLLKSRNKINFSGKNYSELGFFVEEINGIKNDLAGKNWFYYINGRPAQVGISNYIIKPNDIVEWKYENKFF
jgi:hypothetical protein